MTLPRVTVLMPVYNCKAYLAEAIETILGQTYCNFEFLIIDDGSTDGSDTVLSSYARREHRIVAVFNKANMGVIGALNRGLALARGEYVARMDADDVCRPTRLEKQVAFLDSHPNVDVCGCWLQLFGDSENTVWSYPEDNETIQSLLLFHSSMPHATVMLRRCVFQKYDLCYEEGYNHAEDYALWVKASRYLKFSNIPEVLYLYRRYADKVTQVYTREKMATSTRIRREQLERLVFNFSDDEFTVHELISNWDFRSSRLFVKKTESWLLKLRQANDISGLYPEPEFSAVLGEKWLLCCQRASKTGSWGWTAFLRSPVSRFLPSMLESAFMLARLYVRGAMGRIARRPMRSSY